MTATAVRPRGWPREDSRTPLEKGLAVLCFVAEHGEASTGEIGRGVGLSRSCAYRLVERLRAGGYLRDTGVPGTSRIGPAAVPIGLAALEHLAPMAVAPRRLDRLAREAGETVNLAVPRADGMVQVYQAEGPLGVKVTARLGTCRPLGCSSLGKAWLAALPTDEFEERLRSLPLVRLTPRSLVDPAALRADVIASRQRGYAVDDEEVEVGVVCVGAAVRDRTGRPVAAISVAGPAERMAGKRAAVGALVVAAAADIAAGSLP